MFITFFIFLQLIYDGEHLDLTHFAYAHYYLLSVYLVQESHTLGKMFVKAGLSVDVHHPLADDVSSDNNSPGLSHLFSQLIYDDEHFFSDIVTYFAYAHYYLLSVYLLLDVQTVSHSWQNVQLSRGLC